MSTSTSCWLLHGGEREGDILKLPQCPIKCPSCLGHQGMSCCRPMHPWHVRICLFLSQLACGRSWCPTAQGPQLLWPPYTQALLPGLGPRWSQHQLSLLWLVEFCKPHWATSCPAGPLSPWAQAWWELAPPPPLGLWPELWWDCGQTCSPHTHQQLGRWSREVL